MAFEHQTFWKSSRLITAIFFEQNLQSLRTCMYEKRILWKFQKFENLILQGLSKKFEQKIFKFSELYEKRILAKFQKFENLVLQILQNFISLRKLFKENQTLWEGEYIYIERERCVCVCVEASVFASWLLKIPSATLITKACFGGNAIFWQNVVAGHRNIIQFVNF
jgi:hypothetical protein